jgi:small-conductance mechanosensitive channel
VTGEVAEIGLFRTLLIETGNWTAKGHPTGRLVAFMNTFAVTGQYFNFSTVGQWMWDEITVTVPAAEDSYSRIETIHAEVSKQTEADAASAEAEWKRSSGGAALSQFAATPTVNLRPAASGVDVVVRYVTRASERFETRNRLYQAVLDVLQKPGEEAAAQ